MEFPAPQTEGRQRDVNTFAGNPFTGWIYKPTEYEAQSIFETPGDYIDNYGGNIPRAEASKDVLSQDKAGEIGNRPTFVDTMTGVLKSASTSAQTWKTYADTMLGNLKVQDVHPGSTVKGPVPSPTIIHYGVENNMDRKIEGIKTAYEDIVHQVKGLFNLAYEGPVEAAASEQPGVAAVPKPWTGNLTIVVLVALAIWMLSK